MKKIIFILTTLVLTFSVSKAQNKNIPFEGCIEYNVSYNKGTKIDESLKSQIPKISKVFYGKDKFKTFQSTETFNNITITMLEDDKRVSYLFVEMMGQKMKSKIENIDNLEKIDVKEFPEDIKIVEGYECFKTVTITNYNGNNIKVTEYVCKDLLRPVFDPNYSKLTPYIALYTESEIEGVIFYSEATSIKKYRINNSEFEMPSGYKEISPEVFGF